MCRPRLGNPPTLTLGQEYQHMSIYRSIYEQYNGPIPVDEDGRTYEIHHIDGNRKNNDLSNLIAVPIKEHYNIHYKQGDYSACIRIASRMNLSVDEISLRASEINRQRAREGKHPSQKEINRIKTSIRVNEELLKGVHPFQNSESQRQKAIKANNKRVEENTHHFCDPEFSRTRALNRVKNGTHNFQKQPQVECPHCGKVGRLGPMKQWHFDKCRLRHG